MVSEGYQVSREMEIQVRMSPMGVIRRTYARLPTSEHNSGSHGAAVSSRDSASTRQGAGRLWRGVRLHKSILLALVVYGVVCAALYRSVLLVNAGRFVYPLDDTYIHLAMAKNLHLNGTFGVNAGEYASATSAPLWSLVLSGVFFVAGVREQAALVLSLLSGLLLLTASYSLLRRLRIPTGATFVALELITFATPVPLLAFSGMEHLFHAALTIAIVFLAARILAREPVSNWSILALLGAVAISVPARFETLFLAGLVAGLLCLQRRWRLSLAVASAAALPVLILAATSVAHGWFWLPASVLVKSRKPPIRDVFGLYNFVTGSIHQLFLTPHLLALFVLMAALFLWRCRPELKPVRATEYMLVLTMGLFLLHLQFAATGWVMRYEAYLVALGVFVSAAAIGETRPADAWQTVAIGAFALVLLTPLATRSVDGLRLIRHASHNIFEQQYQMAMFLKENYNTASIAANDIGAITFFTETRCFDLVGLANVTVARAMLNRAYSTAIIESEARARGTRLAVIYDEWFESTYPRGPASWTPVARWTVRANYVLGAPTVTFYAIQPEDAPDLRRRLRAFARRLPAGVSVWESVASLETSRAERYDVLHAHRLLHHERLAVLHADLIAVESRHRSEPVADLRLLGKQIRPVALRAVLRRISEQRLHPPLELRRDVNHERRQHVRV